MAKEVLFLFGPNKGKSITTCSDALALEWYYERLKMKHWQYFIVQRRLRTIKFLAQ
jgi:hypothetical protein